MAGLIDKGSWDDDPEQTDDEHLMTFGPLRGTRSAKPSSDTPPKNSQGTEQAAPTSPTYEPDEAAIRRVMSLGLPSLSTREQAIQELKARQERSKIPGLDISYMDDLLP